MDIDIKGRVKNINVSPSNALFPLFEAIANSIFAIEEKKTSKGEINISVEREYGLEITSKESRNIFGFLVKDNGIGFTEENFKSFQLSDSTIKEHRGAKGIGRFLWLKAFKKVSIESVYSDNGYSKIRIFDFDMHEGVSPTKHEALNQKRETFTNVKLDGLKSDFQKKCPKSIEVIATRIVEHFLPIFLLNDSIIITLADEEKNVNLNQHFRHTFFGNIEPNEFSLKNQKFHIIHLKQLFVSGKNHKVNLLAHNREVQSFALSKKINGLPDRFIENEKNFIYFGYISSDYLDENVNSDRTRFNLLEEASIEFPDYISENELLSKITDEIKAYINPFREKLEKEKIEKITKFVYDKAPQHRPVLKYGEKYLSEIPFNADENTMDIELHKIKSMMELDLKKTAKELINEENIQDEDYDTYRKQREKYIEEANDFGKANLAQYISHRKIILELFEKNLKKGEDNKYRLEETIHKMIFPLRKTSDDIDFEKQNLWIIDEKLAYHKYLASDLPLKRVPEIEIDSNKEPDIIIFNSPFAFNEDEKPYSSIVIIEFKRPMRKDYPEDDDPIKQITGYITRIKSGNEVDKGGRFITVNSNTPFFCYIICDLTPKIKGLAIDTYDMTPAPDSLGYFKYHSNLLAYIEIISFDKLLNDAKKRNQILFDKLYLPH